MSKTCKKCNTAYPLTEFHKNKNKKDGLSIYCKSCANGMFGSWRTRNRTHYNQYKKETYQKNKEAHDALNRDLYYRNKHGYPALEVDAKKADGCEICGSKSYLRIDKERSSLHILCKTCEAITVKHNENQLLLLQDFRVQQTKRGGLH